MKFAFFFPAKIALAERNLTAETIQVPHGLQIIRFPNQNVFFSQDTGKVTVKHTEGVHAYFIRVGDYYSPMRHADQNFNLAEWLESNGETAVEWVEARQRDLHDPASYETAATAKREKRRVEREAREAKDAQDKAERAAEAEERYQARIAAFKAGDGHISWDEFERICHESGVQIPIKTKGWGRSNVTKITTLSYTLCGKNRSRSIFDILEKLRATLA